MELWSAKSATNRPHGMHMEHAMANKMCISRNSPLKYARKPSKKTWFLLHIKTCVLPERDNVSLYVREKFKFILPSVFVAKFFSRPSSVKSL